MKAKKRTKKTTAATPLLNRIHLVKSAHLVRLLKKAREIRRNAHAPYSRFKVGAALVDEKGRTHLGCNVENASYGATQCAERAAITAMVAAGGENVREIVIVTDTADGCPPCGLCRQVLLEFSKDPKATLVHIANLSGKAKSVKLSDLVPMAFDAGYFK